MSNATARDSCNLLMILLMLGVQGKGLQLTYWLHGKKGFDKPLPAFDKYVRNTRICSSVVSLPCNIACFNIC